MKTLLLVIAVVLNTAAASHGLLAQDTSLVGAYTVEGISPTEDGRKERYTGRVELTEANGVYSLEWFNDQNQPTAVGVGLRDDKILSVIFKGGHGVIGLASYRIDRGKLIGKWTLPGAADGVFEETLTKADPRLRGAERGPRGKV